MIEFLFYVKQKYGEKAKLYYMDTDSSIVYIKTDDINKNIATFLKQGLTLQSMIWKNHYYQEKTKMLLNKWKMNSIKKQWLDL